MSYHRRYSSSPSLWKGVWPIIAVIALMLVFMFMSNMCSSDEWNDGFCPKCEERYELGGVFEYRKYYYCPECGNEVDRY